MPLTQNQNFPEERRLATVLFADVQGFTQLAERLDYEIVGDLIKEIWLRLDTIVESNGGYIDKHIGDAVMAVWGAPHAGENDAGQAVRAGLALQAALSELTEKTTLPGASELKMRVGINTGPVLSCYVGIHDEYTVIGDTVNVASRLEQSAVAGTVVISESTFRMVRGLFRLRRLPAIQLKGKTEPITPFLVEGASFLPNRVRYEGLGSLETNMVAREVELQRLNQLYRDSFDNPQPTLALVTGEAGLGKSRLMMEFACQLELEEPDLVLVSARSLAQAERVPYFLWKSLLNVLFGLSEEDAPDAARHKFQAGIKNLWPKQTLRTSPEEAAHLIGGLTGLTWPGSPFLSRYADDPQAFVRRAYELVRELLRRLSETCPAVLMLDDLQWADAGSLDLLAYLLQPSELDLRLLILAGARLDLLQQQPRWSNMAEVISLNPLPILAETVAAAYPDLRALPCEVLYELAQRADGNPFFLEEMVKNLVKSGVLEQVVSQQEMVERLRMQTPESLRAMLQARLDALPKEVRLIALLGALSGRVFWVGAVKAALRASTAASTGQLMLMPPNVVDRVIQDALRQLVRAELAFPRAGSRYSDDQEFIFKHSLFSDVAYSLIPHRHHRQYHMAVGQWLANHNNPDFQMMAAEHYEKAGALFEASRQYEFAARYAQARGLTADAEMMLARAEALGKN